MAIDAMKILGSLLSSGMLSRGRGNDILGTVLGSIFGGGARMAPGGSGGGLGDVLGGMLGGGRGSSGGLGGMLGGMLGGGSSSGGGLGDLLGGILGGGPSQSGGGGGLADLIGAAMKQFGGSSGGAGGALDVDLTQFQPNIEPEAANEQALVLVRAMIQAAKADGQVDMEEQQKILEGFGDEVSREELDFLKEEMARPLDVEGLVRSVPRGMEQQVYLMSLTAIDLDTNPEAQYLHQLAQGLGLDQETVNAIHDQLGAPRLYK